MKTINVVLGTESAIMPSYQTKGAAGADMYADISEPVVIRPHETVMIPSHVAMEIPDGYFGCIYPRSGISTKQGLRLANCSAVIDSDFRGEIGLPMHNDSEEDQMIYPQERVAQIVIQTYERVLFKQVKSLSETERGEGGFGSTGK